MNIEIQRRNTVFQLTVDAKEYWLIVKALSTLTTGELRYMFTTFDYVDEERVKEFSTIKSNLYHNLISNIVVSQNAGSDDVYVQFKKDGEFE